MKSLIFFGTLRSKKLLKIVTPENFNSLVFKEAIIKKNKLFKVRNEYFPYISFTNNEKDFVECTYVTNLSKINIKKIMKTGIMICGKMSMRKLIVLLQKNG